MHTESICTLMISLRDHRARDPYQHYSLSWLHVLSHSALMKICDPSFGPSTYAHGSAAWFGRACIADLAGGPALPPLADLELELVHGEGTAGPDATWNCGLRSLPHHHAPPAASAPNQHKRFLPAPPACPHNHLCRAWACLSTGHVTHSPGRAL